MTMSVAPGKILPIKGTHSKRAINKNSQLPNQPNRPRIEKKKSYPVSIMAIIADRPEKWYNLDIIRNNVRPDFHQA